jgi:hypothetical protein
MADIQDLIRMHAAAAGIDPKLYARIVHIESGGNPNARTGSYHGLTQLSQSEFNRYGGGNIYDPSDNLSAGAGKIAAESAAFKAKYGRDPTGTDIYMTHQQGEGGYGMHMAYPDRPAWQNMYMTGEGQEKGPDWARRAIWGNVPSNMRSQFPGGVENLTSRDFVNMWHDKVEGGDAPSWTPTTPTGEVANRFPPQHIGGFGGGLLASAVPAASPSSPGLLGGLFGSSPDATAATGTEADQGAQAANFGRVMSALAQPAPLPAPPPLQLNFPQPVGMRMAQIAAQRGLLGGPR